MNIIVDTNILFASLRSRHSRLRELLFSPNHSFYTPNFLIVEIFKHKERIIKKAKTNEEEVYEFLNKVIRRIHFVHEESISLVYALQAYELCQDIDEDDTPFVALTLEVHGKLWTRDNELKRGLSKKGFHQFFDEEVF